MRVIGSIFVFTYDHEEILPSIFLFYVFHDGAGTAGAEHAPDPIDAAIAP